MATQSPVPFLSCMILDHVTVKPQPVNISMSCASSTEAGRPLMYKLSLGVCSFPLNVTDKVDAVDAPPFPSWAAPFPLAFAAGGAVEFSPFPALSNSMLCPSNEPMAAVASSTEASCTIAVTTPYPFVSGNTLDRCTLSPRFENISFNPASSKEAGSPVTYKLSDGVWSWPLNFTPSTPGAALHPLGPCDGACTLRPGPPSTSRVCPSSCWIAKAASS
mmetsp:Transcript_36122/g.99595  ORF Transcript_36122/g.99595 Transcript_36122/m.99595 type:complete len:218 (-) Transcript_36122:372-1025(-)